MSGFASWRRDREMRPAVIRAAIEIALVTILAAFILATLGPGCARADDVVPLVHEGRTGVWFPLETARALHVLKEQAPKVQQKLRLLEESDRLATQEIIALRVAIADSQEQGRIVQAQLERAIERGNSIWRQPAFWYAIGAVSAFVGLFVVGDGL